MKVAINYADDRFKRAQKYNTKTAYTVGRFDKVIEYTRNDISIDFINKTQIAISQSRLGGYGIWKAFVIWDALNKLNDNDYLFYCDSGAYYIRNIDYLIDEMELNKESIMVFEVPFIEKQWTKREVFQILDYKDTIGLDSNQRLSGFILIKKDKFSVDFFQKYYMIAIEHPELFTDECSIEQDSVFIENRHDQSVLSILSKKYGLRSHRDPSEYGINLKAYEVIYDMQKRSEIRYKYCDYSSDKYPQIIVSHRSPNIRLGACMQSWSISHLPNCLLGITLRFIHSLAKLRN